MTTRMAQLSSCELEARYEGASDPIGKSHFHAQWLLSSGYEVEEVAELLSFSPRWVWALNKRYNEGGPEALGDQRIHNGTKPTILTPAALAALKERIKRPPDANSGPGLRRKVPWVDILIDCIHRRAAPDQCEDENVAALPGNTV